MPQPQEVIYQARKPVASLITVLVAISSLLAAAVPAFAATTEQVLYSFCSVDSCTDGEFPQGSLIFDHAGNLYGTALIGGAYGSGVVFELSPNGSGGWVETVLYNFCALSGCADGAGPGSGLIFDGAGNLYGTTGGGGIYPSASGTVFELSPNGDGTWTETALHSFGNGSDGREPAAGVVMDGSGNLYGTTFAGGLGHSGTVFELKPAGNGTWAETVIHNFCYLHGCRYGGSLPMAGVVLDSSGNLYGTTFAGGPYSCAGEGGCGEVFELVRGSNGKWTEKTLHGFNGNDGRESQAGLIFDRAGHLYGTAFGGGASGSGTVFELLHAKNGTWTEKVLASFGSSASLIFDSSGNLYGTTEGLGVGDGAVFELAPGKNGKWSHKLLYEFPANGQDGFQADANLIFDTAGNLYSTTNRGGASGSGCGGYGCGTVFEITP
jgi:uncharacterized repeat protein (TIGR03803 family)